MRASTAIVTCALLCLCSINPPAFAATPTTRSPIASSLSPTAAPTAPVFSPDTHWVLAMIILVAALLLAAAVIGPIYLMSVPEALPLTHSHDEPPGSSHHHGPSGTVDFSAPDRLG